ncbi:universal stress protein [Corynebacterium falsenii]|uniref:universal stress protein n=1 Tax=Corynebacterium falsenii TaxID=108486 RepID=UPI0004B4ECC4
MYNVVVVGTDGSDSSMLAVSRAAGIAAVVGAELVLASAYIGDSANKADKAAMQGRSATLDGEQAASSVLAAAEDFAREKGAERVRTVLREGTPVEALMDVVTSENADLLVVGNRGINSLTGRLLGSVPADVARQAHCDVMIVHTVD